MDKTERFISQFQTQWPEEIRAYRLGAELACLKQGLDGHVSEEKERLLKELTQEELNILRQEGVQKWTHPPVFWMLTVLNGMCAILQGMDETVINGAQPFFFPQFGVREDETWIRGLVNCAPYLCSALISCWLTVPLNKYWGRRGTVFACCCISACASVGQGLVNSWQAMFAVRIVLGLAIGPVSSTVPMFTAEVAPSKIRGACVMFWQIFTAFGIMMGLVISLVFQTWAYDANLGRFDGIIHDPAHITGLGWRLTMASPVVPSLVIASFIWFVPESPRWYMQHGKYDQAFRSLRRLRKTPLQAARDCYLMHERFTKEEEVRRNAGFFHNMRQILVVARNRRAMYASESLMFMQQFSGINVIAYYSSEIFRQAGFSNRDALLASFGFGATNFFFAFPAFLTIDSFGRRSLLLLTFPIMSACLLMTGLGFIAPQGSDTRTGVVAAGIYLFTAFYSSGAGPMPFTYSSEAYSQEVRNEGMALATATTWAFNSILALTWPSVLGSFGAIGAFCYYAAWNLVGWVLTLFLVPETKERSLEELDVVFSEPTSRRVAHALGALAPSSSKQENGEEPAVLYRVWHRQSPRPPTAPPAAPRHPARITVADHTVRVAGQGGASHVERASGSSSSSSTRPLRSDPSPMTAATDVSFLTNMATVMALETAFLSLN